MDRSEISLELLFCSVKNRSYCADRDTQYITYFIIVPFFDIFEYDHLSLFFTQICERFFHDFSHIFFLEVL